MATKKTAELVSKTANHPYHPNTSADKYSGITKIQAMSMHIVGYLYANNPDLLPETLAHGALEIAKQILIQTENEEAETAE